MSFDLTCAACAESLPGYVAGLSDASERERIERHIQTCDRCRAELNQWQAIGEAVEQDIATIPSDTRATEGWSRLVAQLPARRSQPVATSAPSSLGGQVVRRDHLHTVDLDDNPAHDLGQSFQPPPTKWPTRRWMAPSGVIAALLIVALGATLFAAFASRSHAPAPGGATQGQVNAQPGPPLPESVTMTNVTLAGPGEYWATGFMKDKVTSQEDTGVILRFGDGKWTQVGDALPSSPLYGIEMVSATEGWAWGADFNNVSVVLHISGGLWQRVTVSGVNPGATPQFMRMSSANDGWLVMQNPKTADGNTTPSTLLHYTNGVWRSIQSPLLAFWDIAAIGPDEAWMLGGEGESQAIVHVTAGKAVVALRLSASYNAGDTGLDRLHALAPNDVWATGVRYGTAPATSANWLDSSAPVVYHYDGASWRQIDIHAPAGAQQVQVFSASDMWATRSATVSVFSGQHAPTENRVQALYHLSAGVWREIPSPYTDLVGLMIIPDASTASDVWAIGGYSIYTTTPNSSTVSGGTYTMLLHYLNGEWTEYGR